MNVENESREKLAYGDNDNVSWLIMNCLRSPQLPTEGGHLCQSSSLLLYPLLPRVSLTSAKKAVSRAVTGRKQIMGMVQKKFTDCFFSYMLSLFSFHKKNKNVCLTSLG